MIDFKSVLINPKVLAKSILTEPTCTVEFHNIPDYQPPIIIRIQIPPDRDIYVRFNKDSIGVLGYNEDLSEGSIVTLLVEN